MATIHLNQFDSGIVSDPRNTDSAASRIVAHFDAFTNKHKLTPYRSFETSDPSAATQMIRNFLYLDGIEYGLGSSSSHASGPHISIFKKTNFTNATWTETDWGFVVGSALNDAASNAFIAYHGFIFGMDGTRYVWRFTIDTTTNITFGDLAGYTNTAPPLIHSGDDILYFFYDNKVAKVDGITLTPAALTLPENMIITSACELGNYIAIGCRQSDGQRSRVFLWDRNSSLTTLSDSIDWGEGDLMVLENLEGYLLGVSGPVNLFTNNYFKTKTVFRYWVSGPTGRKFEEFTGMAAGFSANIFQKKQIINNRLYFASSIPIGSMGYSGIWSIARSAGAQPFAVTFDRYLDNSGTNGGNISFFYLADYLFTTYISNGTYFTFKTDDVANYTVASILETTINPKMPAVDKIQIKQLESVGAMYEPLPAAGQVIVKYRVDGGAWVTVFTETTDNAVYTEPVTTTPTGQFTSGKEYELRAESTGGVEITGLIYKYRIIDSNL